MSGRVYKRRYSAVSHAEDSQFLQAKVFHNRFDIKYEPVDIEVNAFSILETESSRVEADEGGSLGRRRERHT